MSQLQQPQQEATLPTASTTRMNDIDQKVLHYY